jgi:hypothetical protein
VSASLVAVIDHGRNANPPFDYKAPVWEKQEKDGGNNPHINLKNARWT